MVMEIWPTYIYLHGFASGPGSTKAQFFVSHLRDLGMKVLLPDLNGNRFRDLTLTNQLRIIEGCLDDAGDQVVIVGSSMGGLLATLVAQTSKSLKSLILLAP